MEKQAIISHTMKINAKIANLQHVISNVDDKMDVMSAFYELDEYVEQLERGLVIAYDISDSDVDDFEKAEFLSDIELEDGQIKQEEAV